jgi:SAM-dependent methyltransferase
MAAALTPPLCPVTGEPAARFVQWVDAGFLAALWKIEAGANARPSFAGVTRFGLWESPTGLHFFDPPAEGDEEFYTGFYGRLLKRGLWRRDASRQEFADAARRVRPGDRVLDVGCGFGNFRHSVPQARYTGLDPHFAGYSQSEDVRNEMLRDHLQAHAGTYDAVCAFQVIEHVREPLPLFAEMVQAARPGGLVIVTVPHIPSAMLRIPNFLMNAPPHHLTWWTANALSALAARSGATVEAIDSVDWDQADSLIHWIERYSFIRCSKEYFRNSLTWHAAALAGYLGGRVVHALRRVPSGRDEGASLMLVAKRR